MLRGPRGWWWIGHAGRQGAAEQGAPVGAFLHGVAHVLWNQLLHGCVQPAAAQRLVKGDDGADMASLVDQLALGLGEGRPLGVEDPLETGVAFLVEDIGRK